MMANYDMRIPKLTDLASASSTYRSTTFALSIQQCLNELLGYCQQRRARYRGCSQQAVQLDSTALLAP